MGGRGGAPRTNLATAVAQAAARAEATTSPEAQIRQAYAALSQREGEWIPLADLRQALSGLSRMQQDEAMRSIAVKPGVQIIPWDNRNALGPRDHAAALRFGGQENHAIRIEG
jgi:hypothetical protein